MIRSLNFFFLILLLLAGCSSGASPEKVQQSPGLLQPINLSSEWTQSSPAFQGIEALTKAVSKAESHPRLTSLLVVRNGKLVSENYFDGASKSTLQDVRSVTKCMVSTLVGIAVSQGKIQNLNDSIEPYLQGVGFVLSEEQKSISIRNLLTMSAGFEWAETNGDSYNTWVSSLRPVGYLLDQPMTATPGTVFEYNSAATNLLARVLEGAVSQDIQTYAKENLFDRMAITSYAWEIFPDGTVNGGSGIDLRSRDLAKIGQLFLQQGKSGSEILVPEEWVNAATTAQFNWRYSYGVLSNYTYGYQWWTREGSAAQDDAFFAWGYGGQFIFVVPAKELVVVTTVDWANAAAAGGSSALELEALELIINEVLPRVN